MLKWDMPIVIDSPSGKDVCIHPIGDLHYGNPTFRVREWEEFKKNIPKDHKIILVGDMLETALKDSIGDGIYTQTASPLDQKEWLYEQLEPLKEQIIAVVQGNHEQRAAKSANSYPLYDVCCRLKIEERFRPDVAFVMLRIGLDKPQNPGKYRPCYNIVVTHGNGNSIYVGSSIIRAERFGMAIDGMDVLCTGHTHKPVNIHCGKLVIDNHNKQIVERQFTVVQATSWLKWGGYASTKMLSNVAFAPQMFVLRSNKKSVQVIQGD